MTYVEREDTFSKEVLNLKDVAKLFDCSLGKASVIVREWKSRLTIGMGKKLHLELDGKIHILDYFEIMGIDPCHPGERYVEKKPKHSVFDELSVCGEDTRKKIYGYS